MVTIEDSFEQQLSPATPPESDGPGKLEPLCRKQAPALTHELKIRHGNAGDNSPIIDLLVQVYHSPQADDFQSHLDEPSYLPSDRLLIDRANEIIGHVQVAKHIAWFHGLRCPLARLRDFVTLPEYHASGVMAPLLQEAESVAVKEGAVLGTIHTDQPEWFEEQGWSRCRGQGHTRANTRSILSHLTAQQSKRRHHNSNIEIRTWRHFQLDSILNVYQQLTSSMWGTSQRSLEKWQWLVGRKAHDQILIAVETSAEGKGEAADSADKTPTVGIIGRPRNDDNLAELNLLGYAVVRDSSIVEMLTLPGQSAAQVALLSQVCQDAIDMDHHFVSLCTPAADPLHELLVTAGGSWIADKAKDGGQSMFKLLSPDRWIERLYPVLHERAREAGIQRPLELDFAVGEKYWRFTLTRRSARFESITNSKSAIQMDCHTLQDLLTSNLIFPEAITQGRLHTVNGEQLNLLAALFPPKLFWESPFSLLRL